MRGNHVRDRIDMLVMALVAGDDDAGPVVESRSSNPAECRSRDVAGITFGSATYE